MNTKSNLVRSKMQKAQQLLRQNRLVEAEAVYEKICSLDHSNGDAWYRLAEIQQAIGKHQEATKNYLRASELSPGNALAHFRLGDAYQESGHFEKAVASYRQAVALDSAFVDAFNNMGIALESLGEIESAISCYEQSIRLNPGDAICRHNLGNACFKVGKFAEAVKMYTLALQLDPNLRQVLNNLGLALLALGRQDEAINCYRRSVELEPHNPHVHLNLGSAYVSLNKFTEAFESYAQALKLAPDTFEVYYNMGNAYSAQNKIPEAIRAYEKAIQIDPGNVQGHWNLSLALLAAGDYAQGWREYEWRWKRKGAPRRHGLHSQWDGSPHPDKTILLKTEQGFGDAIQFVRYAPLVKKHMGKVVLQCQPELVRLLRTVAGIDEVRTDDLNETEFDYHLPLLSLPRVMKTTLASVPATIPYISPSGPPHPAIDSLLKAQSGKLSVGIVWAGRPTGANDINRSCPLHLFRPLAEMKDVTLFSLQKGSEQLSARKTPLDFPVIDLAGHLGDFADTAAAAAQLDLVITVDTAIAHLSGALGKPTWVLLPFALTWRWLLDREDSPWYPTAKLFRQSRAGDWETLFQNVAGALDAYSPPRA